MIDETAKRIKLLRNIAGMTQPELAQAANLPVSRLRQYERGQTSPTAEDIRALVLTLHTSADYLLGLTEHLYLQVGELPADVVHFLQQAAYLARQYGKPPSDGE